MFGCTVKCRKYIYIRLNVGSMFTYAYYASFIFHVCVFIYVFVHVVIYHRLVKNALYIASMTTTNCKV